MVVTADTSFLFSLFGHDVHSPRALAWVQANPRPLVISELTEFELANAFRFAEFCGRLAAGQAAKYWAYYEADRGAGRVRVEICNLAEILVEAKRLSSIHTLAGGHRSFDILHVAAARKLGGEYFLTFDANQRLLAQAESLLVPL
ncbi:type II toxin-antitoxin system VapC family toxin [bacterium]|nr:type II toxin-antitoxin system VapC family toxin [bacterium]